MYDDICPVSTTYIITVNCVSPLRTLENAYQALRRMVIFASPGERSEAELLIALSIITNHSSHISRFSLSRKATQSIKNTLGKATTL
jgi:hypothetical protein